MIRNSASGAIVFMPPEAKDVPGLMAALVDWVNAAKGVPVPLIAALVHYQFVTIHPYYNGNGRTVRLLASFILHRGSYGLNGFFSLEEQHARDLEAYYQALAVHLHHNYYEGRAAADLTSWIEYFVRLLAEVFTIAKEETLHSAEDGITLEPEAIRRLDPRARAVLALFTRMEQITSSEMAGTLPAHGTGAVKDWVEEGWLEVADPSRRAQAYTLMNTIGNLTAKRTNREVR